MGYVLRWGNRTWLYALALGLGIGLAVLLLFKDMIGMGESQKVFWNYYSPMLGYYVLISICQSHYFKRKPVPDMSGMFRQFASIFGAIIIFYVNQAIMYYVLATPVVGAGTGITEYTHGAIIMGGHFTFIVFGFFIYGFDDFMFKGKLLGWMKNDTAKAFFLYFFTWIVWIVLFYWDGGIAKADGKFDGEALNRMLAISQWIIIMSLLYALIFKDWLPDLQQKLGLKNDYAYGVFLLAAASAIGAAIAFLLFFIAPSISPAGGHLTNSETWHHVLYMGTFPLTPAILIGVYTTNFTHLEKPGDRVLRRLMVLIPSVIGLYFAYHWIFARPEIVINYFGGDVGQGLGIFGQPGNNWYHQLDLYFNFTVSIIPLTHHWFCGRAGFVKEEEEETPPERPGRSYREGPNEEKISRQDRPTGRFNVRSSQRGEQVERRDQRSRQWRG